MASQENEAYENLVGRMAQDAPAPEKTTGESALQALADFRKPQAPAPERAQGEAPTPAPSLLERFTQRLAEGGEDQPPLSPEGYNFDGVKDVQEADQPHFEAFKKIALESGLSRKQAASIAEKFYQHSVSYNKNELTRQQVEADRQRQTIEESHKAIANDLQIHWESDFEGNSRVVEEFTRNMSETQFHSLVQRLLLAEAQRVRGQ